LGAILATAIVFIVAVMLTAFEYPVAREQELQARTGLGAAPINRIFYMAEHARDHVSFPPIGEWKVYLTVDDSTNERIRDDIEGFIQKALPDFTFQAPPKSSVVGGPVLNPSGERGVIIYGKTPGADRVFGVLSGISSCLYLRRGDAVPDRMPANTLWIEIGPGFPWKDQDKC
jgi:hypothetical protein